MNCKELDLAITKNSSVKIICKGAVNIILDEDLDESFRVTHIMDSKTDKVEEIKDENDFCNIEVDSRGFHENGDLIGVDFLDSFGILKRKIMKKLNKD